MNASASAQHSCLAGLTGLARLWSMYVEPPWSYTVTAGQVHLDVMGRKPSFDIATGQPDP